MPFWMEGLLRMRQTPVQIRVTPFILTAKQKKIKEEGGSTGTGSPNEIPFRINSNLLLCSSEENV